MLNADIKLTPNLQYSTSLMNLQPFHPQVPRSPIHPVQYFQVEPFMIKYYKDKTGHTSHCHIYHRPVASDTSCF